MSSTRHIKVYTNHIEISSIFLYKCEYQHSQIVKIIKFSKNPFKLKIEINMGTRKNEIIDLEMFSKNKFIRHMESIGHTIETRERFKREKTRWLE